MSELELRELRRWQVENQVPQRVVLIAQYLRERYGRYRRSRLTVTELRKYIEIIRETLRELEESGMVKVVTDESGILRELVIELH